MTAIQIAAIMKRHGFDYGTLMMTVKGRATSKIGAQITKALRDAYALGRASRRADTEMIEAIKDNCLTLQPVQHANAGGDVSVEWQLIEYLTQAPFERIVGYAHTEDPRDAYHDWLTNDQNNKPEACDGDCNQPNCPSRGQ